MTSINTLLNLANSDYYDALTRRNREVEEAVSDKETLKASQLEQKEVARQIQETAEGLKAVRKLQQVENEIEQLSLSQAQMLMQMVNEKIANSTAQHLGDIQMPGERGILAPAYI